MFTVDKLSRTPIYEQLIRQFEYRILSGDIPANGLLPSVRSLSLELGINPNTLQRAYCEIEKRGLCYSVAGSGRYLTANAMERIKEQALAKIDEFRSSVISLKEHGVPEETILDIIKQVYEERKAVEV